ncbi:MAG: PHB depolymerase family esterase, partial [Candidatus Hodarchaeales archaeon]
MKKTKTTRSVMHCILTFMVLIFAQNSSYAQIELGSFEFDGNTRNYSVFLPQNYQPNMPVVINVHGFGQSSQNYMDYTMMNEVADTAGFIVAYPVGLGESWNNGAVDPVPKPNSDDVGFISALIDTLDAHYNIDMARIYCTGFSLGAGMTYRLASELGHRFAAAAPVAGKLSDIAANWHPIRPIPILVINGTKDGTTWYDGGRPGFDSWSVVEALNFWKQNNNCSFFQPADTILLPDIDILDNSNVEKISFTDCSDNSSIIHYKIINGGHHWPGANAAAVFWSGGNLNKDINANVEIWKFFKNYENPLVNIAWAKTVEVFPGYSDPQGDTLFVKAHIHNPENHSVSVYAKIDGEEVSFSDSLLLYDDGMHFDDNPNDNIWGNAKLLSGMEEDIYGVETYTHDFSLGTIHKPHLLNYFTTIGPVVVDNYELQQGANVFTLQYSLRNDGSTNTAAAVSAVVLTTDINVTSTGGTIHFGNIAPGQANSSFFFPRISTQNNPSSIDFIVHIFSKGHFFWSDSLTVTLPVTGIAENETNLPIEYALKQNYPNPFNPTATIQYEIPELGLVELKIYDLLGNEVAEL